MNYKEMQETLTQNLSQEIKAKNWNRVKYGANALALVDEILQVEFLLEEFDISLDIYLHSLMEDYTEACRNGASRMINEYHSQILQVANHKNRIAKLDKMISNYHLI